MTASSEFQLHFNAQSGDDTAVKKILALDLPIYSQELEKVEPLFGGRLTLQRLHQSHSRSLPIKLRPAEPSCKSIYADLKSTQSILIKVKRIVSKKNRGRHDSSNVQVHVVGIIQEKYVCEGMADFQYLTAKRFLPTQFRSDDMAGKSRSRYNLTVRLQRWRHQLLPYLSVNKPEELELIPEVFSDIDIPLKYEFRQRSGYKSEQQTKVSKKLLQYINFTDPMPTPQAIEDVHKVRYRKLSRKSIASLAAIETKLTEMMNKKPIWLRLTITQYFNASERRLAQLVLRKLCYVFLDGPWRGSWIRKGYDPRQSKESARYQVLELRSIANCNQDGVFFARRRYRGRIKFDAFSTTLCDYPFEKVSENSYSALSNTTRCKSISTTKFDKIPERPSMKRRRSQRLSTLESVAQVSTNKHTDDTDVHESKIEVKDSMKGSKQTNTIFGVPYSSSCMLFQLDEINDPEIVAFIARFQIKESEPSLLTGWYSPAMYSALRELTRYKLAIFQGMKDADLVVQKERIAQLQKQALQIHDNPSLLAPIQDSTSPNAATCNAKTSSPIQSRIPFATALDEQDEISEVDAMEMTSEDEEQFSNADTKNNFMQDIDPQVPEYSFIPYQPFTIEDEDMTECTV